MKFKWLYFVISALVLIPGIVSLVDYGLRPAIDFTGGTLLELRFEKEINMSEYGEIKKLIEEKDFEVSSVQSSGEEAILLRLKPITKDDAATIKTVLAQNFEEMPEEVRFETVGPTLGKELLTKTLMAIVLAAGFILAYVAWRFKNAKFGICAILAMFHDSFILLGSFSLMGHFWGVEVNTLFVTAVLTILSLSVHDTVVVYDRIRESQRLLPDVPFEQLANKTVTETLPRNINNSLTIIFMLLALLLLGGETIRWFVVAFLIGTIAGTYSSTFTAVPLLVVWEQLKAKKV
ncbi:MAG TPA: protein translocase subunit SecF [Nevskiaceae bacterium]|nr:protein translocase subunit SecF [Nevskiaceae bacterium]